MLIALAVVFPAAAQTDADPSLLRDLASQDRAHAADARERAKVWRDMAAKSSARAATLTGSFKDSWQQSADDDERSAKKYDDQANLWEQTAKDLDARADAGEKAAAAREAAPVPSVATSPPPTTTGGETAPCDELSLVVGEWTDSSRNTTVTIERANPGASDNALVLKGKHGDWKGTYTPSNGPHPAQVVFRRNPSWKEMDQAAPQWARQQAEGKLEWILELNLDNDLPTSLKGKWYRGQVNWQESGPQTATVASHVDDVPIEYVRPASIDLALDSHPGIQVVTRRGYPWPAESLDRDQGFFVEVMMSSDDAQTQGRSLPVKITARPGGQSVVVTLSGAPHKGPTVYTTDASIIFQKPFDIAGPSDLVYSPADSINLEKLNLKSGDLVTVSLVPQTWGDVSTSFHFYDSWVQQAIARNEEAFDELSGVYQVALATSSDASASSILRRKIQFIEDARHIINDYHPSAAKDQLTDLQRYYVGRYYHDLLVTDTYSYRLGAGTRNDALWRSGPYTSDRFGIQMVCDGEPTMVAAALEQGKEKFKEDFMHAVPAGLALGLYHLVAQLTGGNQIWAALYGINEDGQPVDTTNRVFAGVGFVSMAVFSVASSKYLTDLSPESSARSSVYEPDDRPTARDFEINPDSAATIRQTIEGGTKIVGRVQEIDQGLAQSMYGSNARLAPLDPGERPILQVSNVDCSIEVTSDHIFKGNGRNVPVVKLRHDATAAGLAVPRKGMLPEGYVYLVEKFGGRATFGNMDVYTLKKLSDAGYFINITVEWLTTGSRHAVDFKGFVREGGQEMAVWNDPYFGAKVSLPVCDFKRVFLVEKGKGIVKISDFGQAQPILINGRTFPPLRNKP